MTAAIIALRVGGYLRAYHAVAPLLGGLVVLAILYGGGVSRVEEAYGVSAVVLFPVMAWQAKILLDVEPDVQRRLVRVASGSATREIVAGLVAAAATAIPTVVIGLALPWAFGGVEAGLAQPGQPAGLSLLPALGVGVWTHLLAVPPAVAIGAWASRPISRSAGIAVSVLAGGTVAVIVAGLKDSPAPWLAPPLMPTSRLVATGSVTAGEVLFLTGWAIAWSAVALAAYYRLRLRRP